MKLNEIYSFFIQEGINADPRGKQQVIQKLTRAKATNKKLKGKQKRFFDKENLVNPYSDTRVLYGDPEIEIRRILIGIDIKVEELLLADRLSETKGKIDLVISHHPAGIALAGLPGVMELQTDILKRLGINATIAEQLMEKRINKVARGLHGGNHSRSVDAARLLNIPFMCCHTPADNHVARYLQNLMDTKKPKSLQQIVDLLLKEREYQMAMKVKAGPRMLIGNSQDQAGRILVDMTGGTEGSEDIFARISQLGIKTLLSMHLSEAHFNKIKSEYVNVVIAGHIASDTLGMNLLLDKLERRSCIEIMECSGFRRVKRK